VGGATLRDLVCGASVDVWGFCDGEGEFVCSGLIMEVKKEVMFTMKLRMIVSRWR